MPRERQIESVRDGEWGRLYGGHPWESRSMLTFFFTCMHVDKVVSRPIVCDPFHAEWESCHEFPIENSDPRCGDIAAVDPHGAVVRTSGFEAGKELSTVGRIVYLY